MRKFFYLLMLALGANTNLSAQAVAVNYGVRGGGTLCLLHDLREVGKEVQQAPAAKGEPNYSLWDIPRLSLHGGVYYERPLTASCSGGLEMSYLSGGTPLNVFTAKLNYISVPLYVVYHPHRQAQGWSAYTGPAFNFFWTGHINASLLNNEGDVRKYGAPFEVTILWGVRYCGYNGVSVHLRYQHGLTDVFYFSDESTRPFYLKKKGEEAIPLMNRYLQLSVGYDLTHFFKKNS